MASVVSGQYNLTAVFQITPPTTGYTGAAVAALAQALVLANGTGSNQGDKLYSAQISLAGGANASLDLQTATDATGTAIALAEVRFLALVCTTAGTGIDIKAHAANGWAPSSILKDVSDILPAKGGGVYIAATPTNGSNVVDGTHKVLYFNNTDGAVAGTIDVIVVGCSA